MPKSNKANLWLKVTTDKYELPLMVCDSAKELAGELGVPVNNILSTMSHQKKRGYKCQYVKVEYENDEADWKTD